MITNLTIKNYALIDDISIDFNSGLTIITGETGAGKSILLGALSLLLGKRADLSSVKDISNKCIIEAEFKLKEHLLLSIFTDNKLDFDIHTIIRRELLPSGKSRAFVNDTPVTLSQLQAIAPHIADIHSQNETLSLFSETFQIEVIDVLAGNAALLTKYSKQLEEYTNVSETLAELKYKKETASKELDYNTFLYNELVEANLLDLDQNKLEETYETLTHIEVIQDSLSKISQLIFNEQVGTLETIKEVRLTLGNLRNISSEFEEYWNRLNSVIIELEDVSEGLEQKATAIEADPSALLAINNSLQLIYKLQQKHTVDTVDELLVLQQTLAAKIDITNNLENRIATLEIEREHLNTEVSEIAKKLHKRRLEVIPTLIKKLKFLLIDLGLPNAQFKFDITTSANFRKNGTDSLQLLFTANKGLAFGQLKKVASGGELSRIMLAIKAVLAQYKMLPTLVFDEIDTGLSGEIAYKMSSILHTMSQSMQIFCITHLPQIAAAGNNHIKIYKKDINEITVTRVKKLNKEERVTELAEMIGGKILTDAALNHAKELLN
ncbi:MAG: DNA repair protein RecN [Bacteroidetes bacterium]|nr:DNA repair protein RecN [Bacteroidota bacterium]